MSSIGAVAVAVLGAVLALAVTAQAVYTARTNDYEQGDVSAPARFVAAILVLVWGIPAAVLGAAIGLGAWFGGLSPAAVGLATVSPSRVAVGVVSGLVLVPFGYALVLGLHLLGFEFTRLYADLAPESVTGLGLYTVGVSVQASAEELVFRGALVGAAAAAAGVSPWLLVVPAAVLFALAHTGRGLGSLIHTTVVGVVLGVVFLQFGLVAAALAHVVNNAVAFAVKYRFDDVPFSLVEGGDAATATDPAGTDPTPESGDPVPDNG